MGQRNAQCTPVHHLAGSVAAGRHRAPRSGDAGDGPREGAAPASCSGAGQACLGGLVGLALLGGSSVAGLGAGCLGGLGASSAASGSPMVPSGRRFFSSTRLPEASLTVADSTMRGERLAAQDLLHQVGDVVVLEHVVRELLRVLAGLLGAPHEVLGELVLVDAELLLLGDLVEHELGGDGVADPALEVGLELLAGSAPRPRGTSPW